MAIIRWSPFQEFRPLFGGSLLPFGWSGEDWSSSMPVDVYEEKNQIVVKADLPGFKPEEVEISVTEDSVSIQAERVEKKREEKKERSYLRQERSEVRCARLVSLPARVVADKADAKFEDGTLTLTLPKIVEEKPKQVKIRISKKE